MAGRDRIKRIESFIESKNFAMQKIEREFWYDKIIKDPEWLRGQYNDTIEKDLIKYISKRGRCRYKFIMFTINPVEGTNLELFKRKLIKATKKTWIKKFMYCLEVRKRNHTEGGYLGMHAHMWTEVDNDKYSYDCKREMYNTFKNLVGNKMHVNCRYSNNENAFKDYIRGFKRGIEKDCMHVTEEFRKENNIKDIYD